MQNAEEEFKQKLLATFRIEAKEHVQALSSGLIDLEKAADEQARRGIVETVFREAHSLKGAARAVDANGIETLCHALESIFVVAKREAIDWSTALLDLLHNAVDVLGRLIAWNVAVPAEMEKSVVADLVRRLDGVLESLSGVSVPEAPVSKAAVSKAPVFKEPVSKEPVSKEPMSKAPVSKDRETQPVTVAQLPPAAPGEHKERGTDTVRISAAHLENLLLQVEGLLAGKLGSGQRMRDFRRVHTGFRAWHSHRKNARYQGKLRSTGPDATSDIADLSDLSASDDAYFKSLLAWMSGHQRYAEYGFRTLGGMVDTLLSDMKKVLMLPFSSVLEAFPKLVRDLSRDEGKEVDLQIQGAEIEIDRRILDEMKDPFIHLMRNSINHGIESPRERLAARKPQKGTVTFAVAQKDSSRIEILISDDGAGVNAGKVIEAAQRLGVMSNPGASAGNDEALDLLFSSGVSTSPIVTEISGRGLGLAIVKEKVEKLGGVIAVESAPGLGTRFRIVLPLTLATFRGVEVRVGAHDFFFPTNHVIQCVKIGTGDIKTVENRESIQFEGKTVALVSLAAVLELPSQVEADGLEGAGAYAVIVGTAENRIAFEANQVIEEQEVLVKGLGKQLRRVRNIAGAAILGSGQIVPVLNVPDLMKSAVKAPVAFIPSSKSETAPAQARSILVAEDSITTRTLLQGILESAGYRVTTAMDGLDAFTRLRSEKFDLVVSDVEMPRMDGFTLTARIRAEQGISDLPVILVTALASREHRERGIDVGANGYIVKGSFDQSNLLELIRRFV